MERLTIEYDGQYVPKKLCTINDLGEADDCEPCDNSCKETYIRLRTNGVDRSPPLPLNRMKLKMNQHRKFIEGIRCFVRKTACSQCRILFSASRSINGWGLK